VGAGGTGDAQDRPAPVDDRQVDAVEILRAEPAPAPAADPRIPSHVFVEVVRLMIVALATATGHAAGGGGDLDSGESSAPLIGALLGACVGYVGGGAAGRWMRQAAGAFEQRVERAPAAALLGGGISAAVLGTIGGLVGAGVTAVLPPRLGWPILGLGAWIGVYAGFQAGSRKGEEVVALLRQGALPTGAPDQGDGRPLVIIDASAAIDGRLPALVTTGFLSARLAIPRVVLDELQGLADAADPIRRRRGRRALEQLEVLRDAEGQGVVVLPDEVPEREAVDAKLVVLAQRRNAALLTTDAGLVGVAELQGVRCLSIHRLAAGLRPVLVPGEVVRLTVARTGRDEGQGVGFLEDGTMVVVSRGAGLVGEEAEVCITSSVQTARGRMFFGSPVAA
jgi:uncharacterized protein YacL